MVWCTYCGQAFSRAEHLDRHVITHTSVKPFKCTTCHISFKRRDLLQRHHILVHKEAKDQSPDQESNKVQRRLIACVACARAKTKCDKSIPSCSRCTSKGLVCEARSTKRSNDAAYRLARRQLSSYQRPITIASAETRNTTLRNAGQYSTSSFDQASYLSTLRSPSVTGYQTHSPTPPIAAQNAPVSPQNFSLEIPITPCNFPSGYPLPNIAPDVPTFYSNAYQQFTEVQIHGSAPSSFGQQEDYVYQETFDGFQANQLQVDPELTAYSCFLEMDYLQMGVPIIDHDSLGVVNVPYSSLVQPSRSSSTSSF